MARPVGLAGRGFSVEVATLSPWLVASAVQVLVSRTCSKVAGSYDSIHEGRVSFPFAHCDNMDKHCAGDIVVRVVHGEQLGQTYSGEMHSQNA
jgi:hypothetical protein